MEAKNMKTKIIGIFICILFIGTSLSVLGENNSKDFINDDFTREWIEIDDCIRNNRSYFESLSHRK